MAVTMRENHGTAGKCTIRRRRKISRRSPSQGLSRRAGNLGLRIGSDAFPPRFGASHGGARRDHVGR